MEERASEVSFPALTIPPRPSLESFFNTSSFSPGPMSLVSSFLAEQSPSFSKLLAEEECSGDPEGSQRPSGYKQNRPVNLELAQSPLFMNPSSLSPSVFLNSPGFLSPLQVYIIHSILHFTCNNKSIVLSSPSLFYVIVY